MNLMVAKDKKKNEGIITRAKTNLAATGGGFKFNTTLEECFDAEGIAYTAMAVVWDSTYIDGSPEEILDSVEVTEEEQSRKKPGREAANVFLQSILKNGIKRRDEIMREAVTIKDGPSERTLDRYFEELGFISRNITDEHGFSHAYWGRAWQFEVGQWKPVQGQSYWRQ